jgi:hypothetical protein
MRRILLLICILILALSVVNWIIWHVLGLIAIVVGLALCLFITLIAYNLIRSALQEKSQATAQAQGGDYKVWDTHNENVQLFAFEPTLNQIVQSGQEPQASQIAFQSFTIANNTKVSILEDNGGDAIKVRVLDPALKEKVGWVARTAIVRQ